MLQFNLLPDVKKEYVKARRTKRLIMSISFMVSAVSLGVVLLLFSVVQIAQKQHISDLSEDIKASESRIQGVENINNILTVQNQLSLLPKLHEGKPKSSRLFAYVTFLSPEKAKVNVLDFDAKDQSIVLQGTADSLATVNKFVDNIKSVTYKVVGSEDKTAAPFSGVGTELSGDNEKANFKIEMTYEPTIFDNTKDITMQLQDQTVTTLKPTEPEAEAQQ
ncbi:MAG TPA: hypothetical protein PKD20_00570 [Candidatus Saccharibacteria bacterium]|jgi:ABC-type Na+ efflux pump permease subunit|nr:hypothetical protein [Candidatus Saccharibacteria bacterium]HMT55350.1 hypothetical protein [Candidatus Saccharibacteria bacterium]